MPAASAINARARSPESASSHASSGCAVTDWPPGSGVCDADLREGFAAACTASGDTANVNIGARASGSCSGIAASDPAGKVSLRVRSASKRSAQCPQRTMPSEACKASSLISKIVRHCGHWVYMPRL